MNTLTLLAVLVTAFASPLANAAVGTSTHWMGRQRALVLLVEWKDKAARKSPQVVTETFFGEGNKSLRDFFKENSAGAFDITGDVREWRRSELNWQVGSTCDLDPIVREAWRLHGRGINIADYDADGTGKIDNLFIVHSGRIDSDRVGPDCTFTTSQYADHTIVFQSEGLGSIGNAIPIGFYIHEAGHGYFNLPDLYRNHYHGQYGIGMWGMMGLGAWGVHNKLGREDMFRFPSHYEPYSKVKIGWIKPHVVRQTTRKVTLRPIELSGDIVTIPTGSRSALYLEYRSANGFSKLHAGHGLLVWKDLDLVQADGRDDLNHGHDLGHRPLPPNDENFGDDSDVFPGSANVTSYEDSRGHVRLSDIRQYDDRIELDVETLDGYSAKGWKPPVNDRAPLATGRGGYDGIIDGLFPYTPTDF